MPSTNDPPKRTAIGGIESLKQFLSDFQFMMQAAVAIASAATAFIGFIHLPPTVQDRVSSLFSPLPAKSVAFVSDDASLRKSYLNLLAAQGYEHFDLPLKDIERIPKLKPGIVIVGSSLPTTTLPPLSSNLRATSPITARSSGLACSARICAID